MKIIHVSTAKTWRGGEQQIAYLYEELAVQGLVQMIFCRRGSEMHGYCKKQGIPHRAVAKITSIDPHFAWKLSRTAKKQKPDIIHIHDSHAHSFAIIAASFFGMNAPLILHRRVDYPVKDSEISKLKYNHPQIEKIICVSKEVKRVLDKSLDQTSKSMVVHSGIDLEKFERTAENILRDEFGIDSSKMLIGNVGAVTQQKDYFTFVETAKLLMENRQDVHFFIIGDGDQLEEVKKLTETYQLQDHISFTGFRKDVHKLLPCLDVLLFTSEKEGLGTTLLDAFAAKVPVVATKAGGIPEIVDHGKNGYLADVKDPEALARFVEKLLDSAKTRERLVKSAFQKVQTFDKSEMAREVLKVYKEKVGSW